MSHFFAALVGVELQHAVTEGLPLIFSHPMKKYRNSVVLKELQK